MKAMIVNQDKINVVINEQESLQQTNTIVEHVMDTLNSSNSGTISKRDFKRAVMTFTDENYTKLDVDSIVNNVFKDNVALDRSVIRQKMDQNSIIQQAVSVEPIQDQIMKQLESISSH